MTNYSIILCPNVFTFYLFLLLLSQFFTSDEKSTTGKLFNFFITKEENSFKNLSELKSTERDDHSDVTLGSISPSLQRKSSLLDRGSNDENDINFFVEEISEFDCPPRSKVISIFIFRFLASFFIFDPFKYCVQFLRPFC